MKLNFFLVVVLLSTSIQGISQRRFSEGTIVYNIIVNTTGKNPGIADGFDGATNTIYIKGKSSRSELVSVYGTQSTIVNGKSGAVTVLKEYGDKKFMINMTQANWLDANSKYDSVVFTYESEQKTIAGYNCRKATGRLRNGESFIVYYTPDLVPENQEFEYSNRSLPGLALEYESNIGSNKVVFTATSVSFNPVPIAKFDIPPAGFRIINYEDSKKAGR
jgi:GLPGLI family protein